MESYVYEGQPPPLMYDLMADGITGGGNDINELQKRVEMLLNDNTGQSPANEHADDELIETDITKFVDDVGMDK